LPGERPWPRITVVTPSYNQGEFIERTIRSVLLQGYPQLEYIIIDGGSDDGTLGTIAKYARHLAYRVSEPDRGYVHAINKGFRRATGEILCWLNSDDFYLPGTLRAVAEQLAPPAGAAAVAGHVLKVYADGRPPQKLEGRYMGMSRLLKFWLGYQMHQPSIFWRREVSEEVGLLDEEKDLIADFDYWVRIARRFPFKNVDRILSCATYHERAKTGDGYRRYHEELRRHAPRYWRESPSTPYWLLKASMLNHYLLKPHLRPLLWPLNYVYQACRRRLRMQARPH
jgi:glycosyltransferase involved in cell wall biosynthesis